jgi:hypothetical protein
VSLFSETVIDCVDLPSMIGSRRSFHRIDSAAAWRVSLSQHTKINAELGITWRIHIGNKLARACLGYSWLIGKVGYAYAYAQRGCFGC